MGSSWSASQCNRHRRYLHRYSFVVTFLTHTLSLVAAAAAQVDGRVHDDEHAGEDAAEDDEQHRRQVALECSEGLSGTGFG